MDRFTISCQELLNSMDLYYVLDVRKKSEYDKSHIYGAYNLPVDYWLKTNNENGIARGDSLITTEDYCRLLDYMGIDNNTPIVVYDNNSGRGAARFWWVAHYFGLLNVHILDGGWSAWEDGNFPVTDYQPDFIANKKFIPAINPSLMVSASEVLFFKDRIIVDARSDDEWFCRDTRGNPRMGHIPNALHIEWSSFLKTIGGIPYFRDKEEIRNIMNSRNIKLNDRITAYCQAGVRASVVAFALSLAGFSSVSIYDGSMYEWSRNPCLPLECEEE